MKKVDSEYVVLMILFSVSFAYIYTNNIAILNFSNMVILASIAFMLFNKARDESSADICRDIEKMEDELKYSGKIQNISCKKKILFGINNLDISGVSRILLDIQNTLEKQYEFLDIEIFTIFR